MDALQRDLYTVEDIYALPEGKRAELIDGVIYDMATPGRMHQRISFLLSRKIADYIDAKQGDCEVYPAPFAVFLNRDSCNYLEPDISVICDKAKLNDKGCDGAPDWVIEVTSPSTRRRDYGVKLFKYRSAGVREYWIVNPDNGIVNVYDLEKDEKTELYNFDDEIAGCIHKDFHVRITDLL